MDIHPTKRIILGKLEYFTTLNSWALTMISRLRETSQVVMKSTQIIASESFQAPFISRPRSLHCRPAVLLERSVLEVACTWAVPFTRFHQENVGKYGKIVSKWRCFAEKTCL